MSAALQGIFVGPRHRIVHLSGRSLKAISRPDISTTVISFRYSDLVDIEWVPLYRSDGQMYLSVRAKISLVSSENRFARQVELGLIQEADVLLGRDLLRSSISFRRVSTSTSCCAAPSARVYPLR